MIKYLILIIIGFGSGIVIAGGVFAFIAIIGIVPRFAQKTKTYRYVSLYEDSIVVGGIFGTLELLFDFNIFIGNAGNVVFGFFSGIFIGALAVSLAEVLDVIPILCRRIKLKVGMGYFIFCIAIGKLLGSLAYWYASGFLEVK